MGGFKNYDEMLQALRSGSTALLEHKVHRLDVTAALEEPDAFHVHAVLHVPLTAYFRAMDWSDQISYIIAGRVHDRMQEILNERDPVYHAEHHEATTDTQALTNMVVATASFRLKLGKAPAVKPAQSESGVSLEKPDAEWNF